MLENDIIKNRKGYSLVELLIVMTIIGILALIGAPRYSDFVAKGSVRRAVNDLLQNARLASTMAIKENRNYVIAFNIDGANTYSIGFDTNGDGNPDGYENGPVRVVNLQTAYGNNIAFGTLATSVPDSVQPDQCPACSNNNTPVNFIGSTGVVREIFNPDGSVAFRGHVIINHTSKGYAYILRIPYISGKLDLWMWDGDRDNPIPPTPVECANPPMRYCGWTEIR